MVIGTSGYAPPAASPPAGPTVAAGAGAVIRPGM